MKVKIKNTDQTFTVKEITKCNLDELEQQRAFIGKKIQQKSLQEEMLFKRYASLQKSIEDLEKQKLEIRSEIDKNANSKKILTEVLTEIKAEQKKQLPSSQVKIFELFEKLESVQIHD